ncbi:MAG: winged helix-turn-helix domain-containing protein [Caldimicrobium sp.]
MKKISKGHRSKKAHKACELSAKNENGYELRGKIWIEGKEGTFIGFGRIILLERIKEYGSISKAAKSMKMSYKHAWDLVESMNRQANTPLVITTKGGKGGGGAYLTPEGEKSIQTFWKIYRNFKKFLEKEVKKLPFLKPTP